MIKILAVIGRLLDYPSAEMVAHRDDIVEALRTTP